MTEELILVGGGEHAGMIVEAIRAGGSPSRLLGYVDAESSANMTRRGVPYLGNDAAIAEHRGAVAILGVGSTGSTTARRAIVDRLDPLLSTWARVMHPAAVVSPEASIGRGTVLMAGVVIETGVVIGAHCIVNTGALLCHDVRLADHAVISPGAVVGGGAIVGFGSFIGLGAMIRDHRSVGDGSLVAMGAVVVSDVEPGSTVAGVPALPLPR